MIIRKIGRGELMFLPVVFGSDARCTLCHEASLRGVTVKRTGSVLRAVFCAGCLRALEETADQEPEEVFQPSETVPGTSLKEGEAQS